MAIGLDGAIAAPGDPPCATTLPGSADGCGGSSRRRSGCAGACAGTVVLAVGPVALLEMVDTTSTSTYRPGELEREKVLCVGARAPRELLVKPEGDAVGSVGARELGEGGGVEDDQRGALGLLSITKW
jgi:hypothetical protein